MSMRVSYGSRAGELDVPRNPHTPQQSARPPCSSLAEAINYIKADIQASEENTVLDCTTSLITLRYDAVLELHRPNIGPYSEGGEHDLPAHFKTSSTQADGEGVRVVGRSYPTANVEDITTLGDKESRAVVQRAASRGIVAAVELADGFKYSMNNAWTSKDADGQRFSYICQDSMQNKDRHANGYTRTQKHLKGEHERGPRKPTYDCKGSVSIKCSMVRRTIDIFYRHYAIHSSVAERRHAPRPPPRLSTGGEDGEGKEPEKGGLLGRLQDEGSAFAPSPPPGLASQGGSNIGRPLKRKRTSETPSKPGKPLSLFDLLKQSEAAEKSQKSPPAITSARPGPTHPPPMNYDLPAWQAPPPPPPPPPRISIPRTQQPAGTLQPYQPPYQRTPTSARPPSNATRKNNTPVYPTLTPTQPTKHTHFPTPMSSTQQSTATPLFTTLKPFRVETPASVSALASATRTRSSCTNCRYGKKKCDEQRPVCGSCVRAGKADCAFDGVYGYAATAGQRNQMGGWGVSAVGVGSEVGGGQGDGVQGQGDGWGQLQHQQQPSQIVGGYAQQPQRGGQGQQAQREESPDPWFPKR